VGGLCGRIKVSARKGSREVTEANGCTPESVLALSYARVSYDERAREGYSTEGQIRLLREWAASEGWEVVEEFVDEDWSGRQLSRPGLNRLRERVRQGGIGYVLTTKRDRLVRDGYRRRDLDEEFAQYGTQARALNDSGTSGPFGRFMDRQMDAFAELEREVIAERMQSGKREKALKGEVIGNTLPGYGFVYTPDRKGFEVVEGQMATVRLIFELIGEQHMSINAVRKELDRRGIPSPPTRTNPVGGRAWSRRTIRAMVLDDKYRPHDADELRSLRHPESSWEPPEGETRGILWWNTTRQEHTKIPDPSRPKGYRTHVTMVKNPPEEHIAIPVPDSGTPRAVVDKARAAIADNVRTSSAGDKVWQLSGLLYCVSCGRRMVPNALRKRPQRPGYYYRCPTRQHGGPGACDHATNHNAAKLEEKVWAEVSRLLCSPEELICGIDREIAAERAGQGVGLERERRSLEAAIAEIERKIEGYWDLAAGGDISKEIMRAKVADLEARKREAERRLAACRNCRGRIEELEEIRDDFLGFYGWIRMDELADYTPEERHREYRRLRMKATVDPEGSMWIEGIFNGPRAVREPEELVAGEPYTR
jgi:site-specific DNA recombinase